MLTSGGAGPETESGTQGSIVSFTLGPLTEISMLPYRIANSETVYKRTASIPWRHLLLPCLLPVPVNLIEKRSPNQTSREPAQDNAGELLLYDQRLERS